MKPGHHRVKEDREKKRHRDRHDDPVNEGHPINQQGNRRDDDDRTPRNCRAHAQGPRHGLGSIPAGGFILNDDANALWPVPLEMRALLLNAAPDLFERFQKRRGQA